MGARLLSLEPHWIKQVARDFLSQSQSSTGEESKEPFLFGDLFKTAQMLLSISQKKRHFHDLKRGLYIKPNSFHRIVCIEHFCLSSRTMNC